MSWRASATVAAVLGGVAVLIYLLGPILTPFALGAGLAYVGDPLVDRLERLRLSRTMAVVVVFFVIFAALILGLILLAPLLESQARTVIANVPDWLQWIQTRALPALGVEVPAFDGEQLRRLMVDNWSRAGGLAAKILGPVTASGMAMLTFFVNLLLTPVVTFYLLRDWDLLIARVRDLVPRASLPRVTAIARETDERLGAFLRGQFLVMLALAVYYMAALWLAGLDLAILIGLVSGLISIVPYLGFIVGAGAATVAMLVQTQGDFFALWPLVIVFGVGQVLEGTVLQPWLIGDRIGLHPVAVIFAVMAGGQLFGLAGVLLALPVAAMLAVFLRHGREAWLNSRAYAAS